MYCEVVLYKLGELAYKTDGHIARHCARSLAKDGSADKQSLKLVLSDVSMMSLVLEASTIFVGRASFGDELVHEFRPKDSSILAE